MHIPEITIIGLGGLGKALLYAFIKQQYIVKSIFNRTEETANKLAIEYDVSISASFPADNEELGKLILITVPDGVIQKTAFRLAKLAGDLSDKVFIHCSGNESANVLRELKKRGASIGSLHPLQTFTQQSGLADFEGIFFSLQGDEHVFPLLRNIANQMGAQTLEVNEEQKSHLHAAAVIASNYMITLMDTAAKAAADAGLTEEQVFEALFPLMQTTLKNAENCSLPQVLTGPIKRGDFQTVTKHLTLLKEKPKIQKLYRMLGQQTVDVAQSSGYLNGRKAERMRIILNDCRNG